jgi:hypothetical protein
MAAYPVSFDVVARPEKFERPQLALRVLILVILAILSVISAFVLGLLYLAVPVYAALLVSQKGGETYLAERGGPMRTILHWYLAIYAYLDLIAERFPSEKPEEVVRFDVTPGGSPTVGSALLRLIMSIPSAFVLGILGIVGAVIWLIAAVSILINENYSDGLYNFQLGLNRWQARLLAYHASLVDEYPPFAVDSGPEEATGAVEEPSPPGPEAPTSPA